MGKAADNLEGAIQDLLRCVDYMRTAQREIRNVQSMLTDEETPGRAALNDPRTRQDDL